MNARSFAVYWGSQLNSEDTPTTHVFASEDTWLAFGQGLAAADGWMQCDFVAPGTKVKRDGDFKIPANAVTSPHERHVIWGEHPEAGTVAEAYKFNSPEEAAAFEEGAESMAGWTKAWFVPDASYRPYDSLDDALGGLSTAHAFALAAAVDASLFNEPETWFVNPQGAVVPEHWQPGDPIFNQPIDTDTWNQRFEDALVKGYGITVNDAGLDTQDLARWRKGVLQRWPEQAVVDYAEKYDLTPVATTRMRP